jgi:PAS domain S-box-containing protein
VSNAAPGLQFPPFELKRATGGAPWTAVSEGTPRLEIGQVHDVVWRRTSLLAIIRLTAVVGTVWLAAVFATTPGLIRTFFGIAEISIMAVIWGAAILPLSYRLRFAILETGFFGTTANSMLIYGSTPGIPVLLGLGILVATIYHDRKGGIIAGVASLLLIAAAAWSWTRGLLPIGPTLPKLLPTEYDFWMRTMFAQVLAVCGITGIVAYITREKQNILSRLHLAEEKFSTAFRICPDAMVITELLSGRFIEVNDSHERLIGYTRKEVIGRTSVELGTFTSENDRSTFVEPLLATGSVRDVERKIKDRAGQMIDVVYSAECFDLAGVKCAVTIIRDISDWKRTEAQLIANEERFRSFVEHANVGIYRSTPEGRIIMANPALLKIMGYESFEEMALRNLETEDYEPSYSRKAFREGLEREGLIQGWEATWTRRDGAKIFVRESATVIRGADGAIAYYDGTIEDISERKKAEEALRESEERFRNLTAAAFEGIVITENGRIIDINDQALKLFGYQREEMVGRPASEFVSDGTRDIVRERMNNEFEGSYEHQLVRKDGTPFEAEAQAKMMRMGERTVRMTALRDISERRHNEQRQKNLEEQLRQMQKMEALGTLAGGIAHDFNNILTGILGNLQLAEMDLPKGHPAYVALESADKASRRARDLVARILSFSRLEQDNRTSSPLGPVVREAVQLLCVGLQGDVGVRTDIDGACPPVVFDSGQIHQVIMNLGINSIYAMRAGGGILSVELRKVAPSAALLERYPQVTAEHTVCLTLRDTGCGMDEAVLKRIFEPFYTTKTFGQGTGLGLAMVHAIMNSHKGAIVVESAPGKGTSFDLYFPSAPAAAGVEAAPPAPEPPKATQKPSFVAFGKNRGILLVDDEDSVLMIADSLLRRFGFVVRSFALPVEALAAFRADPDGFSLVISDLTMPEMTGLELAGHILTIRRDIPIILTSGYLNTEALQKARDTGVKSVIKKPFDVKELVAQIRGVLNEPAP